MTKRILTLALIVSGFSLVACSSEPSDLRPEFKVSVDKVPPGTRSSPNLDNATDNSGHDQQQNVQLNHDEHSNAINEDGKAMGKEEETVNKDSVTNHE
ncbi:MAG: hypothetical protein COW65_11520 [Cytophagales bacterium CG18_big_fil_WC_8_21_14_2_50_42_9]|nr:MAG: hypothetical protein COW65_11520 [Cytophagales bacterium CG18_big_fil_WC_8_21_14_2_50_42_9]